ncbi:hypothetical protein [Dictyobacter formicarum]|uniref:DNA-directed DNA polymerase n=1 Tax=Dictyobacter formicarum TaxID=2778368 RepID=A0ABQ3VHA9_9CHLR|nr:hypothetical protein [Dictyobacter formicarum]GHO85198.1 DNA polymerase/3'-5' exonuclease PolX [Dictyobacter formicarum]
MNMTNPEISKLLRDVAAAYAIKDEKKFRFQIIAYQKAADSIDYTSIELRDLYRENKLASLPGVGASIRSHIEELFKTGKVEHFQEVLKDIPASVFPLLEIPSFGPKKAYRLVSEFHLINPETVIADVTDLAQAGEIARHQGFGEKSQQDILQAIQEYSLGKTKTARMVLPYANELAEKIVAYLKKCPAAKQVYPLGSLRRRASTIGDVDIAVATTDPGAVLNHFIAYPYKTRVIEKGDRTASILLSSERQIDLMTQPPQGFGSLLQHFTGSKAHNIHLREYAISKGLSLSEYGIKKKIGGKDILQQYDTEEAFYNALRLQWIPPEMREDTGEIELAIQQKVPQLVELQDMKGDLHLHSSYPIEPSHDMGQDAMEIMIEKAIALNYEYIGFAEHNPSVSKHSASQIYEILENRNKQIEQLRQKYQKYLHIYALLEVDIQPNGDLAIDNTSLELLDAALVSVHSAFDMDQTAMTKRVLKGLSHPKARILAHPTGRLLNQRSIYDLDWDVVFDFCKEHKKALEINAQPLRLDLPDMLVKAAVKKGVQLVIDTDSHAASHMDFMEYGVAVARRGWATEQNIINSLPYKRFHEWLQNNER